MTLLSTVPELTAGEALFQTVLVFLSLLGTVFGIFWLVNPPRDK